MLRLLAIGNNYVGSLSELPDCELDCRNVVKTFKPYCSSFTALFSAGRDAIIYATNKFLADLKSGDLGILYYSGHGTQDRVNGKTVEAIVANDMELIYEFEMRAILNERAPGVMLAMGADSCYSGGLPRVASKRRAIPVSRCKRRSVKLPTKTPKRPNAVFTACTARETAASTGQGGAWTLAFMEAFNERKDKTTLPSLHSRIRKLLPSEEYRQHPGFTCDKSLQGRTLRSFIKAK